MVKDANGLSRRGNDPTPRSRPPAPNSKPVLLSGDEQGDNKQRNKTMNGTDRNWTGILAATTHTTLPTWVTMVLMVSMIFGGCCSNVFALEAIINEQPSAGPLITFAQFILTALLTYPTFLSSSSGPGALFLRPRAIPLRSWLVYTAFFVTVNLLNNWAFAYSISVPLHIIVRSGGPVASMLIGFIFNAKRYSRGQVLAVAMLTAGVVAAALADAAEKGQSMGLGDADAASAQSAGFTILALAMFLSAFQGMYADRLYAAHGRDHWREALFYSHALSIPLFLPTFSQIHSQWTALLDSPSLLAKIGPSLAEELGSSNSTLVAGAPANLASRISAILSAQLVSNPWVTSLLANVPVKVAYLLLNVLTQYICIRGVHLLSARSSSLTVTIVLNIRKLVSLLLSIYLFGNTLAPGVLVGAALVFVGGGLYGFEGARLRKKSSVKKE